MDRIKRQLKSKINMTRFILIANEKLLKPGALVILVSYFVFFDTIVKNMAEKSFQIGHGEREITQNCCFGLFNK